MKRFLVITILALGVLAVSENKASAWSKTHFNIGLNFSREASENSFLWGLFRNGPHPSAQCGQGGGYMPDMNHHGGGYYNPMGQSGAPGMLPAPRPPAPTQQTPQAHTNTPAEQTTQPVGYWNYYQNYRPYQNYQNNYQNQGSWQAPSYWYNN